VNAQRDGETRAQSSPDIIAEPSVIPGG